VAQSVRPAGDIGNRRIGMAADRGPGSLYGSQWIAGVAGEGVVSGT
jgi:hypothetical protein